MDDTTTTGGTTSTVGPLPPTTTPRNQTSSSSSVTAPPGGVDSPTGKTGTDPAQSMSQMGTGARDTSDSKLIDDSTKLFPNVGTMSGEGEGNVFRNERSASTSSTSSSGSDALMGSASTVVEYTHARRASHGHGHGHGLFEGLIDQKRRNDPASVARRQSLSEQRPSPHGFIAKMWDNWVRGVPPDI